LIAAIDVGLKRIGLALENNGIVTPQNPVIRKNRDQASFEVDEFLKYWQIKTLVVGLPFSNEETSRRIKHFVGLLKFQEKIVFVNEDLSSFEAEELSKGVFRHKKDGKNDSLAAAIILERYLKSSELA
jgi:putative Holliday junction resolvase